MNWQNLSVVLLVRRRHALLLREEGAELGHEAPLDTHVAVDVVLRRRVLRRHKHILHEHGHVVRRHVRVREADDLVLREPRLLCSD